MLGKNVHQAGELHVSKAVQGHSDFPQLLLSLLPKFLVFYRSFFLFEVLNLYFFASVSVRLFVFNEKWARMVSVARQHAHAF